MIDVPEPEKGSNASSPFLRCQSIGRLNNSTGFCVGCSSFVSPTWSTCQTEVWLAGGFSLGEPPWRQPYRQDSCCHMKCRRERTPRVFTQMTCWWIVNSERDQ